MEEEQLSLKWNNHKTTFLEILKVQREKSNYTDATLAVEGKFYPVHKLVMCTCSEYFSDIFEKTPCKSPVIVLKDVHSHDIEALLDYMYLGEVNVNQNNLASLLKTAECLRIKGLAVPDEDPTKMIKNSTSSHDSISHDRPDTPPPKRRRHDSNTISPHASSIPFPQKSASSSVNPALTSSIRQYSNSNTEQDEPPDVKVKSDDAEEQDESPVVKVEIYNADELEDIFRGENDYEKDTSSDYDPLGDYESDFSKAEHVPESYGNTSFPECSLQQSELKLQMNHFEGIEHKQATNSIRKFKDISDKLTTNGKLYLLTSNQEYEALEFYQANPIFWDKQALDFKNKNEKYRLVADQAERMGVLPIVLTGWFASQRTIYVKLKKRYRSGQVTPRRATARQKWVMNSFQFLDEHVQFRA